MAESGCLTTDAALTFAKVARCARTTPRSLWPMPRRPFFRGSMLKWLDPTIVRDILAAAISELQEAT